ncbi:MAG: hypothetical protein U9Q77_11240, partial [Candidatus Marinimicrobia bacterium]|nr:hypothetical protein [Candidatus Neomarinimicrobiota bacterium]
MQNKTVRIIILSILLIGSGFAQTGPKLDIKIAEEKVNISDEERNSGIISYAPLDTILYTLTSTNIGDALMTNPVITDPIPAGVRYVLDSAEGQNSKILYSIDGGKKYAEWPVYYSVRNARGIVVRKEASADMVTHVRWEIQNNLEAGAVNVSKLKVVVK